MKSDLGSFICKYIIFAHSISGSDITARLFGLGKGTILKKLKENTQLQQAALVFDNPNSNHDQVREAGEKALVAIYGGKKTDSLNQLRYKKNTKKVAKSLTQVDPKICLQHLLLQKITAIECFCKLLSGRILIVILHQNHGDGWSQSQASNLLLQIKDLLLKSFWKWLIVVAQLTVPQLSRKHGLPCTPACGQCHGSGCQNALPCIEDDEIEELDE